MTDEELDAIRGWLNQFDGTVREATARFGPCRLTDDLERARRALSALLAALDTAGGRARSAERVIGLADWAVRTFDRGDGFALGPAMDSLRDALAHYDAAAKEAGDAD